MKRGSVSQRIRCGSLAISKRPMALRTDLATGVPFSGIVDSVAPGRPPGQCDGTAVCESARTSHRARPHRLAS